MQQQLAVGASSPPPAPSAPQQQVVAIVPMKGHSERIPGKNFRDFHGQPLYAHILSTLQQCGKISQIIVDTDSTDMKRGVQEKFPAVTVVDRPRSLWGDDVPMNEILIHIAETVPAPVYLQTHCTNPLLQAATLDRAIDAYWGKLPAFDSLFSVRQLQSRLYGETFGTSVHPFHCSEELIVPMQTKLAEQ